MSGCHVFVRNWWKRNAYGDIVPAPGARKTTIARGVSEDVARQICREYNETHNPGRLSRKAEYTRED